MAVTLQRSTDNFFWNGTSGAWQAGAATVAVTLAGAAGPGTRTWSSTQALPTGVNLTEAIYTVKSVATDASGNVETVASSAALNTDFITYTIDKTAPVSAVTTVAHLSTLNSTTLPSVFSGTTNDPSNTSVDQVQLSLHRASDGKYWNGTTWVVNGSDLFVTVATNAAGGLTTWSTTAGGSNVGFTLPSGTGAAGCAGCWAQDTYTVKSQARDLATNLETVNAAPALNTDHVTFQIDLTPPTSTITSRHMAATTTPPRSPPLSVAPPLIRATPRSAWWSSA